MVAVDHPDALALARLAPFQAAGRPHQALEDFREMPGMEDDQPHPLPDVLLHALDDLVGDRRHAPRAPTREARRSRRAAPRSGRAPAPAAWRSSPRCPGSSRSAAAIVVVHAVGIDAPRPRRSSARGHSRPRREPGSPSTPPQATFRPADRPASAASARPPRRAPRRASRSRAAESSSARRSRRRRRPARR